MKRLLTIVIVVAVIATMVVILLLNKKASNAGTEMAAQISTAVSVKIEAVKDTSYNMVVTSNGSLEPMLELAFVSDVAGRVVKVLADEGTKVSKGTVLLQVDDEMLRADFQASEAAWKALKTDYERFTNVSEKGGVSTQQLDNVRTQLTAAESRMISSRRRLSDATVKSPVSGVVNKRYVEVGAYLNPGSRLFDIIDDSALKLWVNVTERQVLQLSKNMVVKVASNAFPGETFTGKISFIGARADKAINYPVEVTIDSKNKKQLLAGMFVEATFDIPSAKSGIIIPRNAIMGSVKSANVFVVNNGTAHKQPVTLGMAIGKNVEVLSGLAAGDSIITAGIINVSEGSKVNNVQK